MRISTRMLSRILLPLVIAVSSPQPSASQGTQVPFVEGFDGVVAPAFPAGWTATGFVISATASRSGPNNAAATGNMTARSMISPVLDFTGTVPSRLTFHERRSSTAASYRLEVSISSEDSLAFLPAATYSTVTTTSAYVERTIDLRGLGLEGQPRVQIRWRILPDSTNSTGVLRIDDIALDVLSPVDLALVNLSAEPPFPSTRDSIRLSARVKQSGVSVASPFTADLYYDANDNRLAEETEHFGSTEGPALAPGDSAVVTVTHPPLRSGPHRFFGIVRQPDDVNPLNDSASVVVEVGPPPGTVVINEIMYAPIGDEPEWVELANASPDTIDLRGWRMSDSNTGSKALLSDTSVFLGPGEYAVIARDHNIRDVHPAMPAPVLVVSFSALNNTTPDAVVVTGAQGHTMDSVFYAQSWGGSGGRSLERIDAGEPSVDASNWQSSEDAVRGTPGRINSVARLEHDLMLAQLRATPDPQGASLQAWVRNAGKQTAIGFRLILTEIVESESGRQERIVDARTHTPALGRGDSVVLSSFYATPPPGEVEIRGEVLYGPDLRLQNNALTVPLATRYESQTVVINEILYDPLPGQNEWIELFHRGSASVDLRNWTIADRPTGAGNRIVTTLASESRIIRPGDFVVVAADSSIQSLFAHLRDSLSGIHLIVVNRAGGLGLGNEGDDVVLYDHTGTVIDSLSYDPSWHHPDVADTHGRSLERVNPELSSTDRRTWGTGAHAAGGSPGRRNTLFTARLPEKGVISIAPNPFSPDGDGHDDVALIRYALPASTAVVRIRLFDIAGRLIRTLADGEPAGSEGEFVWNGFDDGGRRARIGPHIVLLEALDGRGGAVTVVKAVVVVATRL